MSIGQESGNELPHSKNVQIASGDATMHVSMIADTRRNVLDTLSAISALAPKMRFGQLVATLSFLAEDKSDHTIWEIEDAELLSVLEAHWAELAARRSSEIEPASVKKH
jgi:hypothetical protein